MILVIDVGNTNLAVGVFQQEHLLHHWSIHTNKKQTEDEYGLLIKGLLREEGLTSQVIEGIIISSVVPPLMFALEKMCTKYFNQKPIVVGPGIKTGLSIRNYENPREIGADRIVNAVAALAEYQPPLIIIDFGTATTFCYIDEQGHYVGGCIASGIKISTEALYQHASKLPRIDLKIPKQVVGRNTVEAMQSGILFGYVGQVDGMIKRIKAQAKEEPTVIATGGFAELIASESEGIQHVEPYLTLKGLFNIYNRNK